MSNLSRLGRGLRGLAVDISPLAEYRDFRLLWGGQLVSLIGRQVTVVAIPFQIYQVSRSSLAVGLLGVAQVVPYIVFSLIGGAIADRYDRRKVLLVTQTLLATCSVALAVMAFRRVESLPLLYVLGALIAALSASDLPSESAIVPNLVAPRHLAPALSLNFAQFQASLVVGPAIGGVVVSVLGLPFAYLLDAASFAAALAAIILIAAQPPSGASTQNPLRAIVDGLHFVSRRGEITGGFAIDLSAMIFGMPRAVFPALAAGTFNGGAAVVGLLYSASGLGATLGSLLSGFVGRIRHQGRAVILSAMLWGIAIALFALSGSSLPLALALLAIAGAADIISAICRNTIIQTVAPDNLRGRASAANSMVVVGGPYLGDLRVGSMAAAFGAEVSVLTGGIACVVLCAAIAGLVPSLRGYHAPSTVPPLQREAVDRETV